LSLTRVRYADLVALPSLDEIKARKAAAKAQRASETADDEESQERVWGTFVTVPETTTVVESALPSNGIESATVVYSDTVADILAPLFSRDRP